MRIALLEDDWAQAELVKRWLEGAGHECAHYGTGREFRIGVRSDGPDLAIVDRVLPDEDGIEVTRWFRASVSRRVPVLFASALGAEPDIVRALDVGADDYVVKPLQREELLARVRALARRTTSVAGLLTCGGAALDTANRVATVHGRKVDLTDREFDLAAYLIANRGRLVSRGELLEQVWKTRVALETRTVDTHASRVRRKLALTPGGECELEAVYNHGYRLRYSGDAG